MADPRPPVPLTDRRLRNPDQEARRVLARALVREWHARRSGAPVDPADAAEITSAGRDRVDEVLRGLRAEHGDRNLQNDPAAHLNTALRAGARIMGILRTQQPG